jgi:acyl transferase domain-containing protein
VSVNNFGFGGTNAHVILESADGSANLISQRANGIKALTDRQRPNRLRLFTLSAKSKSSLDLSIQRLRSWLSGPQRDIPLADLAYTLANRRTQLGWRASFVASSEGELVSALQQLRINKVQQNRDIVFLFTGQGAQWHAMGRELILTKSTFRQSILESDRILKSLGISWSLVEELQKEKHLSRIDRSEIAQPASIAIQIALVDMMHSLNIFPTAVLGHSSGEMGAAYAVGSVTREQALTLSDRRSFIASWCEEDIDGKGAMLAAGLGEQEIAPYIQKVPTEVS